jgi:hypothetical protein
VAIANFGYAIALIIPIFMFIKLKSLASSKLIE